MEIIDCSGGIPAFDTLRSSSFGDDGETVARDCDLLVARKSNVLLNGRPQGSVTCLPEHLAEAVLGHLFVRGALSSLRDVAMVNIGTAGKVVYVHLSRAGLVRPGFDKLLETFDSDPDRITNSAAKHVAGPLLAKRIQKLAIQFDEGLNPLARKRGMHSCALCAGEEIAFLSSDICPESAIEKALGHGFAIGVDWNSALVLTNAPLDTDMLARIAYAGITCVAYDSIASAEALEFARALGITLAARFSNTISFVK